MFHGQSDLQKLYGKHFSFSWFRAVGSDYASNEG